MFTRSTLYVQVFANRFVVRNVDSSATAEVQRDMQFASPRMLIADFTIAEQQLKEAVKRVRSGVLPPHILVHPMELIEGGITQVEHRAFVELGIAAGATKVAVWSGTALSGEGVRKAIREYRN